MKKRLLNFPLYNSADLGLRDSNLTTYYVERYPNLILHRHLVVIHTHEPVALAFGLFRRRIVLSSGLIQLLDEKEIEAVLDLHSDCIVCCV